MSTVVFLGDRFLGADEPALVPLADRGYLHGDSVFATLRALDGRPCAAERHLRRLFAAARCFGVAMPMGEARLTEVMTEAASRVGVPDVTLRVTASRGVGRWGLDTSGSFATTLSVVARPTTAPSEEARTRGVATKILSTRRVPAACLPPSHKTGNYLVSIAARRELEGLVEGVQLSVDGRVSSGTISNLFLVRDGALITPDESADCRLGVTREMILELAPSLGLRAVEADVRVEDLATADEIFFASSVMLCLPVRRVEGVAELRSVESALRLHDALLRAMRG
jgi:branched-chain amino acid aminotransferase